MHTRGLVSFTALLLVCSGTAGRAGAKIPPMPQQDLESMSKLIIRGEVLSTTLVKAERRGPKWRGGYRSKAKILAVEKGGLKPGQLITINWDVVRWVGPGRQPPGHWDHPTFRPCEVFRAHLHGSKASYRAVHYNGVSCLSRCFKGKLPDKAGKTVRCTPKKKRR